MMAVKLVTLHAKLSSAVYCNRSVGLFVCVCVCMGLISWLDKVTNEEALRRVNEDRQILHSIWQRKSQWIVRILRHDRLLDEIKLLKAE